MTTPGRTPERPWHDAPPPVVLVRGPRTALRGERAGIVTRTLANVIDLLVVALVVAGAYAAFVAIRFVLSPTTFSVPSTAPWFALGTLLCVQALYFAVTWTVFGGTYGDRVLALTVTDDAGRRLRWDRSAVRAVLCTVFPVGLAWVLVSRERRSLQDLVLRTAVVYD